MRVLQLLNDDLFRILLLYVALCVLLCRGALLSAAPESDRRFLQAFAAISLVGLVMARAPVLAINVPNNPDEAQMLANAMKFLGGWNSWASVDTTSSGPLNSMLLTWPALFGWDISFFTAKLTQLVALIATCGLLLLAMHAVPAPVVIVTMASIVVVQMGTTLPDFLHYSSETLPVTLLAAAALITFRLIDGRGGMLASGLCGLLLGAVPFAKLQAVPIAAVLGAAHLAMIVLVVREAKPRSGMLTAAVVGALLPAVLILAPLAMAGGLGDFWKSYIEWSLIYLRQTLSPARLLRLVGSHLPFTFFVLGQVFLIGMAATLWWRGALAFDRPARLKQAVAALFLLASIYAVMRPGLPFQHYLWFLVAPLVLLTASLWRGGIALPPSTRWTAAAWPVALIALLGIQISGFETRKIDMAVVAPERPSRAGNSMSPAAKGERLLVWGWAAEVYVRAGLTPATRDIITYNQIANTPLRDYFRARLLDDLKARPPEYVVDAVAPGGRRFSDAATKGIDGFPALRDLVASGYTLISEPQRAMACPRVYARQSLADRLRRRYPTLVEPRASASLVQNGSVFTADKVIDGVTFETCADRWLLPDRALGSLSLALAAPQAIRAVELLNTRNGAHGDRATRLVRIELRRGGVLLHTAVAPVRRYPTWTMVPVPAGLGPVDAIDVHVLAYAGLGGGLNEVRVRAAAD